MVPCAIMRGREPAACARTFAHHQKYSSKMISTNCPIVAITTSGGLELKAQWEGLATAFAPLYSKRLCTQDRRGGRLWGRGVSWISYCSVRPAEETSDVAYYRTTHVCDWKSRTISHA